MKLADLKKTNKYLNRIGAEPRSLLKAVVKEQKGAYWTDICIVRFTKQGDVEVTDQAYAPTETEAVSIREEFSGITWPECVFMPEINSSYPDAVLKADPKDIFTFRDVNGKIIMMQLRRELKGQKSYIPLTFWDDKEFRFCEPEGQLPLFGLENLKDHTTVIISEGAKAARKGQQIANGEIDHPWATELSNCCHLGWQGGALSPERTDWSILQKHGVTRVYIVADNDLPGISAVPKIAKQVNCVTMAIEFPDTFPTSFDLADDFPKSLFEKIEDTQYYVGPSFRDCVMPATWMTNLVTILDEKGKEKIVPVLRHHARNLWHYLDKDELYVNGEKPDIVRKKDALDAMLRPFSDSRKTSELILQSYSGRSPKMVYRPDLSGRRVISSGEMGINTYIPPGIKPQSGDITPFLSFMAYLIPREDECHQALRWTATVIARPDLRPMYGMLMISEQTGTGKSTLGEKILAPLVGMHNTSFPGELDIVDSDFNEWLVKKRLAVVHEIYAGHSFKAANKLKTVITDRFVQVNIKYMPQMQMENFISVYACSNSLKALRIDSTDRRWFIPTITEEPWREGDFDRFFAWLNSGGLSIIADWANRFGDYLRPGEISPMSMRKKEMIEDGLSEAQEHAIDLALTMEAMSQEGKPVSVGYRKIREWIASKCEGRRIMDSDQEIQKAMKKHGIGFSKERKYVQGCNQRIAMNRAAVSEVLGLEGKKAVDRAVEWIRLPGEIVNGDDFLEI